MAYPSFFPVRLFLGFCFDNPHFTFFIPRRQRPTEIVITPNVYFPKHTIWPSIIYFNGEILIGV